MRLTKKIILIFLSFTLCVGNIYSWDERGYPSSTDGYTPPTHDDKGDDGEGQGNGPSADEIVTGEESVLEKEQTDIEKENTVDPGTDSTTTVDTENSSAEKEADSVTDAEKKADSQTNANEESLKSDIQKENSEDAGDPVKITEGVYEQSESDITIGKQDFSVKRIYKSNGTVTSSFGYGWTTNLDERMIIGTQAGSADILKAYENYSKTLRTSINNLESKLPGLYKVNSLQNGKQELEEKKKKCSDTKASAEELKVKIEALEKEAEDRYCSQSVKNLVQNLKTKNQTLINSLEEKCKKLDSQIKNFERDMKNLSDLKQKLEANESKLAQYKAANQSVTATKERNKKAMFSGMGSRCEETGSDTLTIFDENGYPHVMKETSTGSGTWTISGDKQYKSCSKSGNGYKVYQKDGTVKDFDYYGFITKITDRNGNYILISRNADESINYISSSDSECYNFNYENGKIKKITNQRDGSENVVYAYSGNCLTGVKDADGDSVTMVYDSAKRMTELNKCDGSKVCFTYGEQSSDGRILTTQTANEEGYSEFFVYDRRNRCTEYTDHDGNKTVYYYDGNYRTVKKQNADGSQIISEYDSKGNLTKVTENGNVITYTYDTNGNKTRASYTDGSYELFEYDSYQLLTYYRDRDGVESVYNRDSKGNIVEYKRGGQTVFRQTFDNHGNVTAKTEYSTVPVTTKYEYDSYANLKKVSTESYVKEYEYDGRNRVTKVSQNGKLISSYVYTDKTTTRNDYNGLETVWENNGRKDLVCIKQTDKITGRVVISRVEYDKRHLPVKVFEGNGDSEILKDGYIYTAEGKIKAQISYAGADNNNFIRVYSYKNGTIESVRQFVVKGDLSKNPSEINVDSLLSEAGGNVYVQKYDYTKLGQNREKLTVTDGNGNTNLFEYDSFGNLVKITDGNGEESERSYTKGGRLASEQSAHGGWFNYGYGSGGELVRAGEEGGEAVTVVYNPNGSVSTKTDRYGKSVLYSYDSCGRVSSVRSENVTTWYIYDSFGRVIKAVTGNSPYEQNCSYYVTYEYSDDGRSIKVLEGGKYSSTMQLDAFGNVICQIDGNGNKIIYEYDLQNRVVAKFDGYGNKTSYEYGANGGVTKVTGADGNATVYEYNYMGKISRVTDGEGVVYSASYDAGGRLIKEKRRADAEKSYEYDKAGRVVKVLCGGEVVESYEYSPKGRTITVKDGNGSDYIYNYDLFGRLKDEKNRLGDVKQYFYDEEGVVKSQNNFDGGTTVIEYSGNRLTKTVRYADGSENVFEYDATGNIVRAENSFGITEYKYDLAGLLVWQKDVTTGEEVYFEYDAAKNRTKLYSTNRETVYSYGKNNEVLEVYDNKQRMSVSLKYDVCGREVERKFANGVVQKTAYDKAGREVLITQKAGGDITWAEGYVYGEDGKRVATVDNAGRVTMYEYNTKGQLSTVYYPYTKSMEDALKEDAEENRMPVIGDCGMNKYLDSGICNGLSALLNRIGWNYGSKILPMQIFIKESYKYDGNGNRIQKITPYGTIDYTYNEENFLVSSGYNGTTGVVYTYDKEGNLLTQESELKTIKYVYNAQNRIMYSEVKDKKEKTHSVSYYGYDAFGRRILEQDRNQACMKSLYDGFTFDVIKQSPTLANGMFTDSNENGIRLNRTGKATGDRYRYLDDDKNDGNRYFYLDDGNYRAVTSCYVGERTSITVNGVVAGQNAGGEVSYFTTDLLGSVRSTSDTNGYVNKTYTYDVFGAIIEGDLSGEQNFGYLGKQFDPQTGLYNYGYRDYTPKVARFTTVDPIRDGENWFAYVNNDPVNFVDLWGLELTIKVDKTKLVMTIEYKENGQTKDVRVINGDNNNLEKSPITTAVKSHDNSVKKDTSRTTSDGYYPEQFPDGEWKINGLIDNPTGEDKFGDKWLTTNATQKETNEDGSTRDGTGYDIHLTSTTNTNGCVGIHDENLMNYLVDMYCQNEEKDPGTSKLIVVSDSKSK